MIHNIMIEIEKKFLLTEEQQNKLLGGAKELGRKVVEDTYFDTDGYRLTLGDYWLRKRDGAYELKAPLRSGSGSYEATNRYNEITDAEEILRELGLGDGTDIETALASAGIKRFMTCFSDRSSYDKNSFHVDIDSVTYLDSDFEHAVAEIELLVESEAEADEADRRIMEFAKGLNLATDQVIMGKVAAYLKEKRPDHYRALVDAGVLK